MLFDWLFTGWGGYTQSSVLRNTETAPTRQSVSYLNALPIGATHQCQGVLAVSSRGGSPEVIALPGSEPFCLMRFLAPPHQWVLKLAPLKPELRV
jgi:hypothetical protein